VFVYRKLVLVWFTSSILALSISICNKTFLATPGLHTKDIRTQVLFVFLDSLVMLGITWFPLWIIVMGFLVLVLFNSCMRLATKSSHLFRFRLSLNNIFIYEGTHYFDPWLHDSHLVWRMGTGSNPLSVNNLHAHNVY
jgi:hypothetical protein